MSRVSTIIYLGAAVLLLLVAGPALSGPEPPVSVPAVTPQALAALAGAVAVVGLRAFRTRRSR